MGSHANDIPVLGVSLAFAVTHDLSGHEKAIEKKRAYLGHAQQSRLDAELAHQARGIGAVQFDQTVQDLTQPSESTARTR